MRWCPKPLPFSDSGIALNALLDYPGTTVPAICTSIVLCFVSGLVSVRLIASGPVGSWMSRGPCSHASQVHPCFEMTAFDSYQPNEPYLGRTCLDPNLCLWTEYVPGEVDA